MVILALGKIRSRREPNLGCGGLTNLSDMMLCPKSLHESCRIGRCIVVMMLNCSLGNFECDDHKVHMLSGVSLLTADSREIDCSQMHSKVSCDWLPSYIKATLLVL